MNLYRTLHGAWAGTQADAKAAAKEEGSNSFEQVEVPTDKPGLLSFLNENMGVPIEAEPVDVAAPVAAPYMPVRNAVVELQESFAKNLKLEDEIAEADLPTSIRLASHALSRVQEHLRAAERGVKA